MNAMRTSGAGLVILLSGAKVEALLRKTGRLPELSDQRGVWNVQRRGSLERALDILEEAYSLDRAAFAPPPRQHAE